MEAVVGALVFLLALAAILTLLGSWIWIVVVAFKTHPGWGVATLFCYPWSALVFAVMNWDRAKRPALLTVAGLVGMVVIAVSLPLLESAGVMKRQPRPAPSASARPAA